MRAELTAGARWRAWVAVRSGRDDLDEIIVG
jgi:hypothetical protein